MTTEGECRDIEKIFTDKDMVYLNAVENLSTHTPAYYPLQVMAEAPVAKSRPVLNATNKGNTHAAIVSSKTADIDKESFCKSYAEALRAKKEGKSSRAQNKIHIPRRRASQDDADVLVEICVKYMEHEKASILRNNLRNILKKDQHSLLVSYMQANRVKMLVSRHQAQLDCFKQSLRA